MLLNKKLSAALALSALLAVPAHGQAKREAQPLLLLPEVQAELALKSGDYLLLGLRGERITGPAASGADRPLGLDERRLTLGYEHFWSDHWSWGGTARVQALSRDVRLLVPEVLLRHRSAVGPLAFGQRLGLERRFYFAPDDGGPAPESQNWVSLRLDLEKLLPLRGLALRPRLSYEAATHLRLQKEEDAPSERFVQFGRLRGEMGIKVSPRFDFTPWFAYQTTYGRTLPQTDAQGQITIPGGNLNQVAPALGLDLRLTLFAGGAVFERRQLPTQH